LRADFSVTKVPFHYLFLFFVAMQIAQGSFLPSLLPFATTTIIEIATSMSRAFTFLEAYFLASTEHSFFAAAGSFPAPRLPDMYCDTAAWLVPSAAAMDARGTSSLSMQSASWRHTAGNIFQWTSEQGSIR